ncbi:hypothetical protein CYMTET_3224 [Cymbomonas tetramitiformis]|uniref:Helitron helicase-like domain-containing protein n=1 Tax=Cymbomonas tetramitiformis TaxID=36881 RepID=A0AAE0LLK7_9CHLO|nr:hypothetical protein CYMTET_3224 [Cymbomonas tetramitiformis]
MMKAAIEGLLGLHLDGDTKRTHPLGSRESCVFGGKLAAFLAVIEAQQRGALHLHGCLFGCAIAGIILEKIAEDPDLASRAGKVLDSIVQAHLPKWAHYEVHERRARTDPADRAAPRLALHDSPLPFDPYVPPIAPPRNPPAPHYLAAATTPLDSSPFDVRWGRVAASANRHDRHTFTCRKPPNGRYGCRLCMPQALHPEPTGPSELLVVGPGEGGGGLTVDDEGITRFNVTVAETIAPREKRDPATPYIDEPLVQPDERVIVWEPRRPENDDTFMTAFNRAFTAVSGGNTAMYMLGSAEQAKAAGYYMFKYMVKDPFEPAITLSCLYEATKSVAQRPSVAENAGTEVRTAQHLIQRTLNNMTGAQEIGVEQGASFLLGMPSVPTSERFWYVHVWAAVKAFASERSEGSEPAAIDESVGVEEESDDDCADEGIQDGMDSDNVIPDYGEAEVINQAQPVQGDAGATVYRGIDSEPVPVSQHTHYLYRGVDLAYLNLVEYGALVDVIRQPKKPEDEEMLEPSSLRGEPDNHQDGPIVDMAASRRGRPVNGVFNFHPDHPLHDTHVQRIRSKFKCPILAGGPPPRYPGPRLVGNKAWMKKAEKYSSYMLALIKPWDISEWLACIDSGDNPRILKGP